MTEHKLTFTQIPNWILDNISEFDDNEFKVLLYICRKTYGWHKEKDLISLSQFMNATGKARQRIHDAIQSLLKKRIIAREIGKLRTFNYYIVSPEDHLDSLDMRPSIVSPGDRKDGLSVSPGDTQKKVLNKSINKEESRDEIMSQIESGIRKCGTKEQNFDRVIREEPTASDGLNDYESKVIDLFKKYGSINKLTPNCKKKLKEYSKLNLSLNEIEMKLKLYREKQKNQKSFSSYKLSVSSLLNFWNDLGEDEIILPPREEQKADGLEGLC